jgi:hypothetical protein
MVVYIPIGNASCSISHKLIKKNLRKNAYPFDWLCCPLSGIYKLIKNDFNNFLEDLIICKKEVGRYLDDEGNVNFNKEYIYPIICKKYKFLFLHDFKNLSDLEFKNTREKYKRRIERLINIFKSDDDIILVHDNIHLIRQNKLIYRRNNLRYLKTYDCKNYLEEIKNIVLLKYSKKIKIISKKDL